MTRKQNIVVTFSCLEGLVYLLTTFVQEKSEKLLLYKGRNCSEKVI